MKLPHDWYDTIEATRPVADCHRGVPLEELNPDWTLAPGDILREELLARDMTQGDLAEKMGRPLNFINQLINAKRGLTARTAVQLEDAGLANARLWLTLDMLYRLDLERGRRRML